VSDHRRVRRGAIRTATEQWRYGNYCTRVQIFIEKCVPTVSSESEHWEHAVKKENKLQIRNGTAEFLIFTREAGDNGIDVRVAEETAWPTQKLIGMLFNKGRSTITEHLRNLFETGELDQKAACRDFRHTAQDGKDYTTRYYNLDAT
jgi:hypothetical protein